MDIVFDPYGNRLSPPRAVWHAMAARHRDHDQFDLISAFEIAEVMVSDPQINISTIDELTRPLADC